MVRSNGALVRLAWALSAIGLSACESELGKCDEPAARELVYGRSGLVATKGQALMHDSCGQAAFCHSSNARGAARHGAPAKLDFDVLPAPRDISRIVEMREQIWDEVHSGHMPPENFVVADSDWLFDLDRKPGSIKLPPLSTEEGRGVLRNWLACRAPSVSESKVPSWALRPNESFDLQAARWSRLHTQLKTSCVNDACHDGKSPDGGFSPGEAQLSFVGGECAVYRWLAFGRDACGERLVVGGDPDNSSFVRKVEDESPPCGGPMPPHGNRNAGLTALVRDWVKQGAWAPQCGEYSSRAPRMETADAGIEAVTWEGVYADIIVPTCATANCHDTASAKVSGQLDLSDKCGAHKALLTESGPCGKRVTPGDASSMLVDKVASDKPKCGLRMPVGVPLAKSQIDRIRAWVVQGASAEGCE